MSLSFEESVLYTRFQKRVHFVLGNFPLLIVLNVHLPKSRSEHVHYNRTLNFKFQCH